MAWHIEVRKDGFGIHHDDRFVPDHPLEMAVNISKANPNHDVWVNGFARCRRVLRDGVVVRDNPNLDKFYAGVSDSDAKAWSDGLEIND